MYLEVLATGSKGNCYLLHTSKGIIILEAGVRWQEVLKALDFNIINVVCCLITHEHQDHCKYANEFAKNVGTYASKGTIEAGGLKNVEEIEWDEEEGYDRIYLKDIYIDAFETQHDAKEPIGFIIWDTSTKERLLFATDTYYVKYRFRGLNYILVECNYAKDILEENMKNDLVPLTLSKRLLSSHFELSNVKEFIKANDNPNLREVVLLHMSDTNGDAKRFKEEVGAITLANVNVAVKGLKLDLGGFEFKNPMPNCCGEKEFERFKRDLLKKG